MRKRCGRTLLHRKDSKHNELLGARPMKPGLMMSSPSTAGCSPFPLKSTLAQTDVVLIILCDLVSTRLEPDVLSKCCDIWGMVTKYESGQIIHDKKQIGHDDERLRLRSDVDKRSICNRMRRTFSLTDYIIHINARLGQCDMALLRHRQGQGFSLPTLCERRKYQSTRPLGTPAKP